VSALSHLRVDSCFIRDDLRIPSLSFFSSQATSGWRSRAQYSKQLIAVCSYSPCKYWCVTSAVERKHSALLERKVMVAPVRGVIEAVGSMTTLRVEAEVRPRPSRKAAESSGPK
jgi:hypothetical protein